MMFLAGLNLGCLVLITLPLMVLIVGTLYTINPILGWIVFMGLCYAIGQVVEYAKENNRQ